MACADIKAYILYIYQVEPLHVSGVGPMSPLLSQNFSISSRPSRGSAFICYYLVGGGHLHDASYVLTYLILHEGNPHFLCSHDGSLCASRWSFFLPCIIYLPRGGRIRDPYVLEKDPWCLCSMRWTHILLWSSRQILCPYGLPRGIILTWPLSPCDISLCFRDVVLEALLFARLASLSWPNLLYSLD